jgi:hypothetical protein
MIRQTRFIFCDNEHGTGDVTFPNIDAAGFSMEQHFIWSPTAKELRKEAKKAGWGVVNRADYCPGCMEGM